MKVFLIGLLLASAWTPVKWRPEVAQLDPEEQQWFSQQYIPRGEHKGGSCCSLADGTYAQEDIRYDEKGEGHYWTRFHYGRYNYLQQWKDIGESDWMQVPDDAVINDKPNRHGSPAVWYYFDNQDKVMIRCYAPGVGI